MNFKKCLRILIKEQVSEFFHGTRTTFPFPKFDPRSEGTGIVSSGGQRYGGFFFTSNKENAEYFTEWFVATVNIANIQPNPTNSTHPPTVLRQAVIDKKNYQINDVLDGGAYSNVVVVPMSNLNDITILNWEFIGDEESYFESMDDFFGHEDINDINQSEILSLLRMIEVDPNYLLNIPIFKKYFESKP